MARTSAREVLPVTRGVSHPWFRAQALAYIARWIDDHQVERVAREAIAAGLECHDAYKQSAVMAWPIAALVERERIALARETLVRARALAAVATPNGSRAYALLGLLRAAWGLEGTVRRSLVRELAELQQQDGFWRVSVSLIDAVVLLRPTEPEIVQAIVAGMIGDKWRRKAIAAIGRADPGPPASFFR